MMTIDVMTTEIEAAMGHSLRMCSERSMVGQNDMKLECYDMT
jgi:hypothetical protein